MAGFSFSIKQQADAPLPWRGRTVPWQPKKHRPYGARSEQERKKEFDERRESAAARGYDAWWRRLRKVVLSEEPLCRECSKIGRVVASAEVDHIIPHKGNMKLFRDRKNLQGLCKPCHSRKTATEDSAFARKAGHNSSLPAPITQGG